MVLLSHIFILAALSLVEFSIVVGVVIAFTAIGFCFGMISERWSSGNVLKKAASNFEKSVEHTLKNLEKAQQACKQLETFPNSSLSKEVQGKLESHQGGLLASLGRLLQKKSSKPSPGSEAITNDIKSQSPVPVLEWVSAPVDERSLLPDQIALDENLSRLVNTAVADNSASLLLVQIDRFDSLAQRYGDEEKNHLLRSIAKLLVRLAREEDLVCHSCDDLFAVLIPQTKFASGSELADHIRQSIRAHRFRLTDVSREVLMTASFGFYNIESGDNSGLAFNRAMDALGHSKRKGRNQLHYHDGQIVKVYREQKKSLSG